MLDAQLVLLVCPVRQPRQGGGKSRTLQHGRKQLDVQRPRHGHRFVELLLRLCKQLAWRGSALGLPLQLLFEVQRHDDQELLEPVVQRPGDLLARMVLGERQVPRHLAQLRRPVFQFGRALLKGHCGTLAFGDVGHERECASAARRRNVIDGDFDRKHGPVLADADEVLAARRVRAVAKHRWHQALDRLADQLFGGPAEHHLDRTIRKDDHPTRVRRNDALRGGLEQRSQRAIVFLVATRLESILSPAALGDVQVEPSEPRDSAVGVAVGSAPALDPCALFRRAARSGTCSPTNPWLSTSRPRRAVRARPDGRRRARAASTRQVSRDRRAQTRIASGIVRPSRPHWSRGPTSRSRRPTLRARGGAAVSAPAAPLRRGCARRRPRSVRRRRERARSPPPSTRAASS